MALATSKDPLCHWRFYPPVRPLARHDADPRALLADHSRRPHASPGQTDDAVTRAILDARRRYGWGARKLHGFSDFHGSALLKSVWDVPSTVSAISLH